MPASKSLHTSSTARDSRRAGGAAPRRDHHGRQRPLGEAAPAAARRRPPARASRRCARSIRASIERGIEYLTLFAFSSENWRRPPDEVSILMELFLRALEQEVAKLHENGIRFKVVGDLTRFSTAHPRADRRRRGAHRAQHAADAHDRRELRRPLGHRAGRAALLHEASAKRSSRTRRSIRTRSRRYLAMAYAPEPDLFIRTGGEQRICNFLLWQLAYTELYFTDLLWPDFDARALDDAIASYRSARAPLRPHQRAAERAAGDRHDGALTRSPVKLIRPMALSSLAQRVTTAAVLVPLVLAALFLLPPRGWAHRDARDHRARGARMGASSSGFGPQQRARVRRRRRCCIGVVPAVLGRDGLRARLAGERRARHLRRRDRCSGSSSRRPGSGRAWPHARRALPMALAGWIVLVGAWVAIVELQARSPWLVLAAMAIVWIADTAAYFTGRTFGRRKLAPSISPGKTLGGRVRRPRSRSRSTRSLLRAVRRAQAGLRGPRTLLADRRLGRCSSSLLAPVSVVGDLYESMLKRQAGVKDSGDAAARATAACSIASMRCWPRCRSPPSPRRCSCTKAG